MWGRGTTRRKICPYRPYFASVLLSFVYFAVFIKYSLKGVENCVNKNIYNKENFFFAKKYVH